MQITLMDSDAPEAFIHYKFFYKDIYVHVVIFVLSI